MAQDSSAVPPPTSIPGAGVNGTPATASPKAASSKKKAEQPEGPRDTTREVFETVVFVIVLVLLLKLFVAEAFVIPTGSMATTLWGDQYICTCRECGHSFPVGARDKEAPKEVSDLRTWYICENCGYEFRDFRFPTKDFSSRSSGDRVLVSKYEYHIRSPRRFEVPVFKYPVEPFSKEQQQAMNYIKRFAGLENETLGIYSGDLYRTTALTYPHNPRPMNPDGTVNELDLWRYEWMYASDPEAISSFKRGEFELIRKAAAQILASRRVVFDLNHQPKSLDGIRRKRWHPAPEEGTGWAMEETGFHHTGDALGWVRYQHLNPWQPLEEKLYYITDNLGYNLGSDLPVREAHPEENSPFRDLSKCPNPDVGCPPPNWVSDLILECEVEISSADAEVILDLAKGPQRYQARFQGGQCRLYQIPAQGEPKELGSKPTRMTKPGSYKVQLANVDCRMTVWVNGKVLPFSTGESDYSPPDPSRRFEPTANDYEQPARIGSRGDVRCTNVKLWRDLYYSCTGREQARNEGQSTLLPERNQMPVCAEDYVQTYYVQPGHYLALGDNSNSSADSRTWGLVPKRLLLGRAIVVYFPFSRMGVIE